MVSSLPEVVEQFLRPVRAALGAGESLHHYADRIGVSYSALYKLLHGRGTPRYDTLLRLHAALARPVAPGEPPLVPEPFRFVSAEPWFGRRSCIIDGLTRFSVLCGDAGSGVSTALSLLDFLRDPIGGALPRAARSGAPLVSEVVVEARTDTIVVASSIRPCLQGPCAGAIQVNYEVTRTIPPAQMVHAQRGWVWPGSTYLPPTRVALVDLDCAAIPVDESVMREVVQHEYARNLLRAVGSPCDGRPPRGSLARIAVHLLVAVSRGCDLLLFDCVDPLLGPSATRLLLNAAARGVEAGHLGQVVVGTHQRDTATDAMRQGANVLSVRRSDTIAGALDVTP